jgi:ABC-2 type transport system permease protein
MEMELRRIKHDYTDLITRSVQPILWLVVFGSVFEKFRILPTGSYTYLQFIAPGILGQSVLFISIFFGLNIVWDRESGLLAKLLVSPAPTFTIALGKAMAAGVRGLTQAVVVLVIVFAIGIPLTTNPIYLLGIIPVVILLAGTFASLSMVIASFARTRERFMGIGQVLTMPLFFTSSALYPINVMPIWLQLISRGNPLSYGVDALRSLLLTGNLSSLGLDFAVLIVALLILSLIAGKMLKGIME